MNTIPKLSEERINNILKGNIELKVYCGYLMMREEFNVVKDINNLNPKQIESVIKQLHRIQLYVDRNCFWFSERFTHNLISDWNKNGSMWDKNVSLSNSTSTIPKDIDFDIKRWLEDFDYYMWIFNNHREIHSMIGGFFENITNSFKKVLTKQINKDLKGENQPKEPMIKDNIEYWETIVKHHGKKKTDKYFLEKMKNLNDSFEKYDYTPQEKLMKEFNRQNMTMEVN